MPERLTIRTQFFEMLIDSPSPATDRAANSMNRFLNDVLTGLNSKPKCLHSKYLYDGQGDILFEEIMHSEEYYVTDCELEILKNNCERVSEYIKSFFGGFDLIELGAGDASKSYYLLKCLQDGGQEFTYYPIDISSQVIHKLQYELPEKLPGLSVRGLNGDYFVMLREASRLS